MSAPRKIALIVGSTRSPRVGLAISKLVHKHLTSNTSDSGPAAPQLELLDLHDHLLPLFDEGTVPQDITDLANYSQEHTRAWSRTISAYSGFVMVTPQYNWGMPAGLKNNIDYLFNEWKGKPVMVVSYGGRGGGRAADNLQMVCRGLRMDLVEERVELSFGKVEGALAPASRQGELVDGAEAAWMEDLEKGKRIYQQVVEKVMARPEAAEHK